jgi:hypothetical protein
MKSSIDSPVRLPGDRPLHWFKIFTATALLIIGAGPAAAADGKSPDQWEFGVEVYLWGASIGGTTSTNSGLEVSFGDLLKDLEMGFMGAVGAKKGKWLLLGDVVYLDVEQKESKTYNVANMPVPVSSKVELKGGVITLAGGYAVMQTEAHTLNLLVGARYLDLDTDLSFNVGGIPEERSGSGDAWDAIIGVKGQADFAEKWYLSYYLDVGTGDTDFTWQGSAAVGYQFKPVDVVVGYRYLAWDFDDGDPLAKALSDLEFHGPFAGVKWVF